MRRFNLFVDFSIPSRTTEVALLLRVAKAESFACMIFKDAARSLNHSAFVLRAGTADRGASGERRRAPARLLPPQRSTSLRHVGAVASRDGGPHAAGHDARLQRANYMPQLSG